MSEFQNIPVGKQAQEMDISPQFRPYSGVEIVVSEDTAYFAGNESGRVLRIENPWGTQAQADNILASLTQTGFQYQPYTADNALVNPAAEIGDAVTVNGTYSGIYKMNRDYSSLMATDIAAPQDEEVDHEFPYEPKQDRIYKRELAEARAQIKVNHDSIEAEVFRASEAEGQLSSAIQQTATEISANVLKRTGGSSSSFGWTLTDSSWELTSNNQTVFKATSSGVEISGKVTANSGSIGGFTISGSAIYNGPNSLTSGTAGVYVGKDGIRVNGTSASFRAEKNGNVYLTGDLYIGGTKISAANLRSGAATAYGWANTKLSGGSTQASIWSGGATTANKCNNVLFEGKTTATYIKASHATLSDVTLDGYDASWKSITVITGTNPVTRSTIQYYGR